MKISKCSGEGQGSCKRCSDQGKWNIQWMCFLYKIDGLEGCYCSDCVKEIFEENPSLFEDRFEGCEDCEYYGIISDDPLKRWQCLWRYPEDGDEQPCKVTEDL